MKRRIKAVLHGFSGRMVCTIALSFAALTALFMGVLFFREWGYQEVFGLYNTSLEASKAYSMGYLDVKESKLSMERFFTARSQEDYLKARECLLDAREGLMRIGEMENAGNKRAIIDLTMMIDTCLKTNAVAYADICAKNAEGYAAITDAGHQYDLLLMMYDQGWEKELLALTTAQRRAVENKSLMDKVFLLILIVAAALAVVVGMLTVLPIRHMIRRLNEYAAQFRTGTLDVERLNVSESNDFKPMVDALNTLVDEVHSHVKNLEAKRDMELRLTQETLQKARIAGQLKQSRINELQSAMNPHFLFNTLNLIACTAYMEEAPRTHQLMEALSVLLRHNLSQHGNLIRVKREMESIEHYVLIQRERFGESVTINVESDPACVEDWIPTFIIQPILENAIIHGLRHGMDGGMVTVTLQKQDERLWLDVTDNGCGMSQSRIEEVLCCQEKTEGHLGLLAVFQRVRLIFGAERCHIQINSGEGRGTHVHIDFPVLADEREVEE